MSSASTFLEDLTPADLELPAKFSQFREVQRQAAHYALYGPGDDPDPEDARRFHCLGLAPGCHANPIELVLMADGKRKRVMDVQVGDVLAGHTTSNTVLRLNRGAGRLYEIVPVKGKSFTVNEDHVLTLKWSGARPPLLGRIIDISVREFLKLAPWGRARYKLLRSHSEHGAAGVNLPLDPYLLGLILGDGCITGANNTIAITKPDPEVGRSMAEAVAPFGLVANLGTNNKTWTITKGFRGPGNDILDTIRRMGLWGSYSHTKFIPDLYLLGSMQQRAELLAGLLDTDGSLGHNGFDFISASPHIADGVVYLSRSLGLAAYMTPCEKYCQTGSGGTYYRVSISGHLNRVPTRIPRKQATDRQQIKNVLVTGFDVRPAGKGDYWGFTLSGDGRYLLGDFTVTHNSGKELLGHIIGALTGEKYAILTATRGLEDQQIRSGYKGLVNVRGRNNYHCNDDECATEEYPEPNCQQGEEMNCNHYGTLGCSYYLQTEKARLAPSVLTNYAYWMAVRSMNRAALEGGRPITWLICDEAHLIPDALSRFLATWVSHVTLRRYANEELRAALAASKGAEWGRIGERWMVVLGGAISRLSTALASIADGYQGNAAEAARRDPEYRKLDKLRGELERIARHAGDNNWLWRHAEKPFGHGIEFACIWPAKYAESYVWTGIPHIVPMSATLRPKNLDISGIGKEKRHFKEWPRIFPSQHSPVYWVPTGRIGKNHGEEGFQRAANRVDDMAKLWTTQRGIVHVPSYKLANFIKDRVDCHKRVVTVKQEDGAAGRLAAEKKHRETPGSILIAPSFMVGFDFADEACEWQLIPQLPWLYKGDPVVQARMEDDKDYYNAETMNRLVQACYRGTRHENDKCVTVVTDDAVRGFRHWASEFAPRWFKVLDRATLPGPR